MTMCSLLVWLFSSCQSCSHVVTQKVVVELLDSNACFPPDRKIRGCHGPTGARRQIKQGGYPWSDTWSHFKGWERPLISSHRVRTTVCQGLRGEESGRSSIIIQGWYEWGWPQCHLNDTAHWPSSNWRGDSEKRIFFLFLFPFSIFLRLKSCLDGPRWNYLGMH